MMKHSKYKGLLKPTLLYTIILLMTCSYQSIIANVQWNKSSPIQQKLASLEVHSNGRLGIFAINTANNTYIQYRANERFPMGCTSKVIGVAAILKESMTNPVLLQEKIKYTKKQIALAAWTPDTSKHQQDGMTIAELCGAAIMHSDNLAMNLLVKKMGGLRALNTFAKSIGNEKFRADRMWPDESHTIPGNVRDTVTPRAMAESYQKLVLGNILAPTKRELLQSWLKSSTTGYKRIRAGVPKDWIVGDKTGTAEYGTTNDVAIIWPPHCAPMVLAAYFTQNKKNAKTRGDVLAAATKDVIRQFAKTDSCIRVAIHLANKAIPVIRHSTTHVLHRLNVPQSPYRVGMGVGHLKPNTLKPWHLHAGPEAAYIIKGSIIVTIRGQSAKTYTAGQSYEIPPGVVHKTQAGPDGASYVSVWVVQRGKEDQFTTQVH